MTVRERLRILLRGGLLLAGCVGAVLGSWALAHAPLAAATEPVLRGAAGTLPLEAAVDAVCAAALLGCVAWCVASTVLALTAYAARLLLPRSRAVAALCRVAERGCPALVRSGVAAGVGLALTVTVAGPVLADPPAPKDLTGLALPERTTGSTLSEATPPAARRTAAVRASRTLRVVRPGDSLWSIAADLLPDTSSDRDVSNAWHRLHRANAARIGPDPDLILPGTRLVVPDLDPHRKEPS